VKLSLIAEVGNGVFLQCTPLVTGRQADDTGPLKLRAGELLDLGAYAPFCKEDKKLDEVMIVKNFFHSHNCVKWAFNSVDCRYCLGITNDVTSKLYAEATMQHVHAFHFI
jgi:hypothetical protein